MVAAIAPLAGVAQPWRAQPLRLCRRKAPRKRGCAEPSKTSSKRGGAADAGPPRVRCGHHWPCSRCEGNVSATQTGIARPLPAGSIISWIRKVNQCKVWCYEQSSSTRLPCPKQVPRPVGTSLPAPNTATKQSASTGRAKGSGSRSSGSHAATRFNQVATTLSRDKTQICR